MDMNQKGEYPTIGQPYLLDFAGVENTTVTPIARCHFNTFLFIVACDGPYKFVKWEAVVDPHDNRRIITLGSGQYYTSIQDAMGQMVFKKPRVYSPVLIEAIKSQRGGYLPEIRNMVDDYEIAEYITKQINPEEAIECWLVEEGILGYDYAIFQRLEDAFGFDLTEIWYEGRDL